VVKTPVLIALTLTVFVAGCSLDSNLFNTRDVDHYSLPGNTIPDSLIEEVVFDSEGNTLYGYWVESDGTRPGLAMLYCHGNKHNLDEYWDRVMLYHRLGVNVFIYDYRGFGRSGGESSEDGMYRDAEAALGVVRSKGFAPDSIVIYGYSLGNVASIYLAAEKVKPRCLIAEAPFASANSLTQGSLILDIPERWLTDGEFNNAERVKRIRTPFLLIHGENDDFVRWRDNGRVVFENAPEPKRLALIPRAKHDDIPAVVGEDAYLAIISGWITAPGMP
jgi:hypothetical protein